MCGRYASTRSATDLARLFDADWLGEDADDMPASYNVAPTDPVAIVRRSKRAGGRVVSVARWGLVPPWAADPRVGSRMINARAETVATSTAYRRSFAQRRCLVPADGWYEWLRQPAGPGKQAYFMTAKDGSPLAFGGLWTVWGSGDDQRMTCSIVTTAAIGDLRAVHDRMPLVLPAARWAAWLGEVAEPIERLLAVTPDELVTTLELRPVGRAVGDVRRDGPDLIRRIPLPDGMNLALF